MKMVENDIISTETIVHRSETISFLYERWSVDREFPSSFFVTGSARGRVKTQPDNPAVGRESAMGRFLSYAWAIIWASISWIGGPLDKGLVVWWRYREEIGQSEDASMRLSLSKSSVDE
jgi:hypothetical protein